MHTNDERKVMMLNEARVLGHAEARTKEKLALADELVEEGKLSRKGRLKKTGRWPGGHWYELVSASAGASEGPRVRLLRGPLGASEADDLTHVVGDKYDNGDEGVLAFEHPNPELAAGGWVFVEVDAKSEPARKLYVGVGPSMYVRLDAPLPTVAAIGRIGDDCAVWGLGIDEMSARGDALYFMREQGVYCPLKFVEVDADRVARVRAGDVAAEDLWEKAK